MAKTETFQDGFNFGAIDAVKWGTYDSDTTLAVVDNQLKFDLASGSVVTGYAGAESIDSLDLTGSYMYTEIIELPSSGGNSESYFTAFLDASNYFEWYSAWGYLYANYMVGGGDIVWYGEIINSAATRWLRIREEAGTSYWDYSADGFSWTNLTSISNLFTITSINIVYTAGNWETEVAPGNLIVDNFNCKGFMGIKTYGGADVNEIKTINGIPVTDIKTIQGKK